MKTQGFVRFHHGLEHLETRDVPAADFTTLPLVPDFSPEIIANVRHIAYTGEQQGRRENVFMKVGDSNSHSTEFVQALGSPTYNPTLSGMPADLLSTWAVYRAPADMQGHNSYNRDSLSDLGSQFTAWMLDHLDDELAVSNASVALIQAGTTEVAFPGGPTRAVENISRMIDELSAAGVIPIISTIPWMRYYGSAFDPVVEQMNQALANLAEQKSIPIINLWRAMDPLPNNGLKFTNPVGRDFLHLNISPSDPGGFQPFDLAFAQNIRSLLVLQTLKELRGFTFDQPDTPLPEFSPWTAPASNQATFATGSTLGDAPVVTVFDSKTGNPVNSLIAYEPSFRGGVHVAVGDVNGDGISDVVTGPGLGGGPLVKAFSGEDGSELFRFFAYEDSFRGGVTVAVGDTNGDGTNEIVVGSGEGGGPRVRVFQASDQTILSDFFAFEPSFRGGVNVAVGNFGGTPGIAAGSGFGGAPVVNLFDGRTGNPIGNVMAYEESLRSGVSVAAGDLDGDGFDEIVTAPGRGNPSHIRTFDPITHADRGSFFADSIERIGGFHVAVIHEPEPGTPERILTGSPVLSGQPVKTWSGTGGFLGGATTTGTYGIINGAYVGG